MSSNLVLYTSVATLGAGLFDVRGVNGCVNGPIFHEDFINSAKEFHEEAERKFNENVSQMQQESEEFFSNFENNTSSTLPDVFGEVGGSPSENDSFFAHPLDSLSNMFSHIFDMGSFFGGLSPFNQTLVHSETVELENGAVTAEKEIHHIHDDEGKLIGKRTTYNFEGEEDGGVEAPNGEFYQIQSDIIFTDVAGEVVGNVGNGSLENEQYYDDGSDDVKSENKSENDEKLSEIFAANEKQSYRRPNFKQPEKLVIEAES